jgi:isopentenyldiphosphate isomerase
MYFYDNISLVSLEWEIFQKNIVEKIEIHILFSIYISRISCRLLHYAEKFGRAWQARWDNTHTVHALYMPRKKVKNRDTHS